MSAKFAQLSYFVFSEASTVIDIGELKYDNDILADKIKT